MCNIGFTRRRGGTESWVLCFCLVRVFFLFCLFGVLQWEVCFFFVVDEPLLFLRRQESGLHTTGS